MHSRGSLIYKPTPYKQRKAYEGSELPYWHPHVYGQKLVAPLSLYGEV